MNLNNVKVNVFWIFMLLLSSTAYTQSNTKEALFNQAMLDLGQNKVEKSVKTFEKLYQSDSTNMNLAYLLGQSYARLGNNLGYSIYLLEKAEKRYSANYRIRDFSERSVSEYVYYYLLMAYSLNGNCEKTIGALNKFYSIYSFSNEYYLIEGQQYHLECDKTIAPIDSSEMVIFENRVTKHWVSTKTVSYTNKQPLYGVQIGATLEPKFTWEFKDVKNVEVYLDENGIYRYIIGKLISPIAAQKLLSVIQEAGYPDAFIVNVKEKTKFSEKVVNMDNKPIANQLVGDVIFRVQVGAFKSDTIPEDLAYLFIELDSISEINDGNWTYLTVGKFTDIVDARFYLELIRDLGVKDAFVTAFNYSRKVDLRQAEAYLEDRKKSKESADQDKQKKRKN